MQLASTLAPESLAPESSSELPTVSLDDKYAAVRGRVYLTGIQALVRLLLIQRQRDAAQGLNTAGFVSGYRGSPLGALDLNLWRARPFLERANIHFQPGLNEDLAATAVWGSQQVNLFEGARYDGVFGMWYGKGPGIDRSGDVFKHANAAGTSRHGGVLVVAGDDHGCKSSTLPSQSEYSFMDAMMPVLNPSGVQEILDYGLLGFALSRYSGCWVGFKTIADTVDTSASVYVDPDRVTVNLPADFDGPESGLHIRWPDRPMEQEYRLQRHKLYAALAFAKANHLNQVVVDSPSPRLGVVTTGKSYLDVRQALDDLGVDDALAAAIGLRVLKVGMSWPLERDSIRDFAEGLTEIVVVEEKRAVIENQLREQLYNWRESVRPRVVGKFDENNDWLLPSTAELTPARIARVLADRIEAFFTSPDIKRRLEFLEAKERSMHAKPLLERTPHFCSGCPHNTSTRVPEGSRAMGGIGCHYMATWMNRSTDTFAQMGGEGVTWIGQAPFTETPHVFQNLGDGTYFHSGVLAIRAAVAAKVNITYKILFNDAVAMTGGQPLDGTLSLTQLTAQLRAEGVDEIVVVSDEPDKYSRPNNSYPSSSNPSNSSFNVFATGVKIHHRDELDGVQRDLREIKGVSVLIYDQTCAAEKRRRRKRGEYPDPPQRLFINPQVCEGCGDCSRKSNCLSVTPVETELGRKRAIDQHACNKDWSCLNGFCPSFVTVSGGELVSKQGAGETATPLPVPDPSGLTSPPRAELTNPYGIVITGVGGTGVVTVGALLGMAAHLEGKGGTVLDMTGLAQKYGSVVSHVRIASAPEDLHASRISAGNADLLLGCDLVVSTSFDALSKCSKARTQAVVNDHPSMTAAFIHNPDLVFKDKQMRQAINAAIKTEGNFVNARELAVALVGNDLAANILLLGFAYQKGLVPLSLEAIEGAIELNAVAVEMNKRAFTWGRLCAQDLDAVLRNSIPNKKVNAGAVSLAVSAPVSPKDGIERVIEVRREHLEAYQNSAYGQRYLGLVEKARAAERARAPGAKGLVAAVARGYHKVLAYKDEYEVARLYTDPVFKRQLRTQFTGNYKLHFHLAPTWLVGGNVGGEPRKRKFGPWILKVFWLLARLKGLRGTRFDPFGLDPDRREERMLIVRYEATMERVFAELSSANHAMAVELAGLPEKIRGFGHIKRQSIREAEAQAQTLLEAFSHPVDDQAA